MAGINGTLFKITGGEIELNPDDDSLLMTSLGFSSGTTYTIAQASALHNGNTVIAGRDDYTGDINDFPFIIIAPDKTLNANDALYCKLLVDRDPDLSYNGPTLLAESDLQDLPSDPTNFVYYDATIDVYYQSRYPESFVERWTFPKGGPYGSVTRTADYTDSDNGRVADQLQVSINYQATSLVLTEKVNDSLTFWDSNQNHHGIPEIGTWVADIGTGYNVEQNTTQYPTTAFSTENDVFKYTFGPARRVTGTQGSRYTGSESSMSTNNDWTIAIEFTTTQSSGILLAKGSETDQSTITKFAWTAGVLDIEVGGVDVTASITLNINTDGTPNGIYLTHQFVDIFNNRFQIYRGEDNGFSLDGAVGSPVDNAYPISVGSIHNGAIGTPLEGGVDCQIKNLRYWEGTILTINDCKNDWRNREKCVSIHSDGDSNLFGLTLPGVRDGRWSAVLNEKIFSEGWKIQHYANGVSGNTFYGAYPDNGTPAPYVANGGFIPDSESSANPRPVSITNSQRCIDYNVDIVLSCYTLHNSLGAGFLYGQVAEYIEHYDEYLYHKDICKLFYDGQPSQFAYVILGPQPNGFSEGSTIGGKTTGQILSDLKDALLADPTKYPYVINNFPYLIETGQIYGQAQYYNSDPSDDPIHLSESGHERNAQAVFDWLVPQLRKIQNRIKITNYTDGEAISTQPADTINVEYEVETPAGGVETFNQNFVLQAGDNDIVVEYTLGNSKKIEKYIVVNYTP